jgi:PsbP-like protein
MSHLPSVPPGRLLFVTGIAILLCFVVFSGCTQPEIPSPGPVSTTQPPVVTTGAPVPPVTTSQVTQKGSDYLTYTNSQYGFSISYPSGWAVQENTGGSVVTFQAPSEGRDDLYRENLKVTVEDLSSSPMSLEQYKSAQLAKKQSLASFNLIYDQAYRVSGFNGWKIAYTANSGMLMEWVEIFTIKGTTAYDITFSAQESSYANYVVAMDTMTKSFQLTS